MTYNVQIKNGSKWEVILDETTNTPKGWTDKTQIPPIYTTLYPSGYWRVVAQCTLTETYTINDPV